jgi:translation initiation factor 1A
MGKKKNTTKDAERLGAGNDNDTIDNLVLKGDDTGYGLVRSCLGDGRFDVLCEDLEGRLGILRGSMRNRVWISAGSVILYGQRTFQKDKVDILHLYSKKDVCVMLKRGLIARGGLYDAIACGQEDVCSAGGGGGQGLERNDSMIEFRDADDDAELTALAHASSSGSLSSTSDDGGVAAS